MQAQILMDRIAILSPISRFLISFLFIVSGLMKILEWSGSLGYLEAAGLPYPGVFLGIAAAIELIGGFLLLTGIAARAAAFVMFLYLIPVTLTFHAFWMAPLEAALNQLAHFLKNLSIMGGLLFIVGNGPGAFSLGGRGRKGRVEAPPVAEPGQKAA
jgi:putative oxidoreductase